jgi:hypothetical protein
MPYPFRVTISSNANEYAALMRVRADNLTKEIKDTGDELGKIALARAEWWSSGPYKQSELTRMGHPYAKRNPKRIGQKWAGRINEQTGEFKHGWKWSHVEAGSGDMVGTLSNDSDHAKYLTRDGTSRMVGRPVREGIAREVRKEAEHLWGDIIPNTIARSGGPLNGVSGRSLAGAFRRGFSRGLGSGIRLGTALGSI